MPKPAKGPRLGGSPSHERHMLNNLAQSLFEHGSITTTVTRAKRVQPVAERLVQLAKRGDLAARRRVLRQLSRKDVVAELFETTAPKMVDRHGGYTRVTQIGNRKGDNAPMAVIELVLEPVSPKQAVVKEATKAAERAARTEEPAVGSAESIAPDAGDTADAEDVTEAATDTQDAGTEDSVDATADAETAADAEAEADESGDADKA